jgi:putative ABC transport system permease protein
VGIVTGIVGAAGLVRVMGRFFTTTTALSDAPTMAGVTIVLALLALWACYLPARRATRVDPMRALRQE